MVVYEVMLGEYCTCVEMYCGRNAQENEKVNLESVQGPTGGPSPRHPPDHIHLSSRQTPKGFGRSRGGDIQAQDYC